MPCGVSFSVLLKSNSVAGYRRYRSIPRVLRITIRIICYGTVRLNVRLALGQTKLAELFTSLANSSLVKRSFICGLSAQPVFRYSRAERFLQFMMHTSIKIVNRSLLVSSLYCHEISEMMLSLLDPPVSEFIMRSEAIRS